MFYFRKMKSVLKCLSVSHILFSLSSLPFPTPHPSFPGRRLPTSLSGANHCNKFCSSFKKADFVFFAVFLTVLVGASPSSWITVGRRDVLLGVPTAGQVVSLTTHSCQSARGTGTPCCGRGDAAVVGSKALASQDLVQSAAGNCHSASEPVWQGTPQMTHMGHQLRLRIFQVALGGHCGREPLGVSCTVGGSKPTAKH